MVPTRIGVHAALGEPRVADLMAAGARLSDERAAALAFGEVHDTHRGDR